MAKEETKNAVIKAIKHAKMPTLSFEIIEPPRKEFGDLSCSLPLTLSRKIKRSPKEIADELVKYIKREELQLVKDFEAHPSGFINFKLNMPKFTINTIQIIMSGNYIIKKIGKNKRVLIEHTSVNPAHPLHIGHVRNLAIGDTIYRILKYCGYEAKVLNYIDDLGLQVADLLTGIEVFRISKNKDEKIDHYYGRIYVAVNRKYEENEELKKLRVNILKEMENPSSKYGKMAREITREVLKAQLDTCWRLGARYDCLNFESHIIEAGLWEKLFKIMKDKGAIELCEEGELKGCWVVRIGKEEFSKEKVLVRSDGTTTYIAKDIPYAAWKLGLVEDPFSYEIYSKQFDNSILWQTCIKNGKKDVRFGGADIAITVIDDRQSRLQRIIAEILSQIKSPLAKEKYIHLAYAIVSLSKGTAKKLGVEEVKGEFLHMSGRKGIYLSTDEVLNALFAKAYEETRQRNPNEKENWLKEIAEKIAIGAIRYSLVRQDLSKIITFDMESALRLEGDTGPYLQYSYARACNIIEKAKDVSINVNESDASLLTEHDHELVKVLSKFDLAVEEAASLLSPKSIAKYAYELATTFNSFYEKCPVIHEDDKRLKNVRLLLVKSYKEVMKDTLNLLGIEPLERL